MHLTDVMRGQFNRNMQVSCRQHTRSLLGPLDQFETGTGKDVPKTRLFPFLGIIEPVKVKMPDGQIACFMRFDHCIGRAFDPALHTQGPQKVPHQRGFACPQIALQFNVGIANGGTLSQCFGIGLRVIFRVPHALSRMHLGWQRGISYNRCVTAVRTQIDPLVLWPQVQTWALELGFSQIGVTGVDLSTAEEGLQAWLNAGFHGSMAYMASHGMKRARPKELVSGTVSVITARMDYLPLKAPLDWINQEMARADRPGEAVVSLYARGRDYHKVLRHRLQQLQTQLAQAIGPFGHRVFTDSAPVLEAELACRSGLGWRGKNTLVLQREAGSMFFLGELFIDFALPPSEAVTAHCGQCTACIDLCPTKAIVGPRQLDARRCISYLTIEHAGPIPHEFRPLIGNRIYGCDECQLVCPWNKYAQRNPLPDFEARSALVGAELVDLLGWSEHEFLHHTEGSAIRRIGHARWLRNVALAAGNALVSLTPPKARGLKLVLHSLLSHADEVVREQAAWSLAQG